jgi:hypothetical protein
MCKISNEIKLCSCGDKDVPLTNMWILRANSISEHKLVGEFFASEDKEEAIEKLNYNLLLNKLNKNNLFDFDYVPENGDELEIRICQDNKRSQEVVFVFYFKHCWTKKMPLQFWEETHIKHQGIINNPLKTN